MLPEIGASELMVIAAVALIVVGPKDLPVLLRKLGQFVAKLRGMANDFRSSFDEMARQSELDDLRKEVAAMRAGQLPTSLNPVDDGHVNKVFDDIDAGLHGQTPLYDPAVTQDYDSPDAVSEPEPLAKPKRARKPKTASETTIQILPEPEPAPAAKPRAKAAPKAAAPKAAASKPAAAKTRKTKA